MGKYNIFFFYSGRDEPLACAPLAPRTDVFKAVARFPLPDNDGVYNGSVFGEVLLTQEKGNPQAPTTLDVRVAYTCTRTGYSWSMDAGNVVAIYGPSRRQPVYVSAKVCSDACRETEGCGFWSWASEQAPASGSRYDLNRRPYCYVCMVVNI